jgi:hypothetical protein
MFRSITAVTLLALAAPVMADGLNYNFIEGKYQRTTLDDGSFDIDGDTFGIGGSFAVGDMFQVIAGYDVLNFDIANEDVDLKELTLGGGIHMPLSTNVDFFANLAYFRVDAGSSLGESIDDSGFGGELGLRAMLGEQVELAGALQYIELSDFGNDTRLKGNLWYNFSPNFALGVNAATGEDTVSYGLGARIYFGN